jgi:threonine dehydratase
VTTLGEIWRARAVITGRVHRTPLIRSSALGRQLGLQLFLKAECLQKTGSFKVRGVLTKLAALSEDEKRRGLITISAGNHGQAVAYAAAAEGVRCVVVMPEYASTAKIDACRGYDAEVIVGGDVHQAFAKARELEEARGLTLVHPYDDPAIIAGQGTIGLEILEDLPEPDAVVIPYGGGGLTAGIASAVKQLRPETKVFTVEPETGAPFAASKAAGAPQPIDYRKSFVDGAGGPVVLPKMWGIDAPLVDEALSASLEDTAAAVRLLAERVRVVAEGAGALSTAAALSGRAGTGKVVCIVSGGNIDASRLVKILGGETPE